MARKKPAAGARYSPQSPCSLAPRPTQPDGNCSFELRETYQNAQCQQMVVRCNFVEDSAQGPVRMPNAKDGAEPQDSTDDKPKMTALNSLRRQPAVVNRTYVHLLDPDTLRPALRGS